MACNNLQNPDNIAVIDRTEITEMFFDIFGKYRNETVSKLRDN